MRWGADVVTTHEGKAHMFRKKGQAGTNTCTPVTAERLTSPGTKSSWKTWARVATGGNVQEPCPGAPRKYSLRPLKISPSQP